MERTSIDAILPGLFEARPLLVIQVSGNHRLEDNKVEQERIRAQGCEVSPSLLEGKPCGPLRVWPGGLAMGRSIGDYDVSLKHHN